MSDIIELIVDLLEILVSSPKAFLFFMIIIAIVFLIWICLS